MEEWRNIEGYENYQISNMGNVRSLNFHRTGRIQLLKPEKNKGYLRVQLCKDGKHKSYQLHRLVAQAFLPNPDNLPQVNHRDENPSNNRAGNLEWCSAEYNCNYGNHNQRMSEVKNIPVAQYTKEGELIAIYYAGIEASKQTGISHSNISECCKGNRKTAGGYIWKYA